MSLIPESEIEKIKNAVNIEDVIGSRLRLKGTGKERVGLCPFHDEFTPSFSVTPAKQLYFCFGCGAAGNVIGFIERFEGRGFLDALRVVAEFANLPMPTPNEKPSPLHSLYRATSFYESELKKDTQEAKNCRLYLASRGISEDVSNAFGLGFAPPGGFALGGAHKSDVRDLAVLGLLDKLKSRAGHIDRFRNRLVIPVRGPGGQTIGLTARTLVDEKPKYLNSQLTEWFRKDRALFGIDQFRKGSSASVSNRADRVYVVEGQTDVLTCHSSGEHRMVGVLGRSVGPEQVRMLLSLADTVIFTFDGDNAGELSIKATLETLLAASGESGRARFKRLPAGEDPSSLILGKGLEAFYAAPEKGFLETIISFLPEGNSPDEMLAKAEAGMEYIEKVRDPLLRDAVIRAVAQAANLSPEALSGRFEEGLAAKIAAPQRPAKAVVPQMQVKFAQRQFFSPEAALWRALLEEPGLLRLIQWPELMRDSEDRVLSGIPRLAKRLAEGGVEPTSSEVASSLNDLGMGELVRSILAMPGPSNPKREAEDILAMLEQRLVKEEISKYIKRVASGEKLSESDRAAYVNLVQQKSKQAEGA